MIKTFATTHCVFSCGFFAKSNFPGCCDQTGEAKKKGVFFSCDSFFDVNGCVTARALVLAEGEFENVHPALGHC